MQLEIIARDVTTGWLCNTLSWTIYPVYYTRIGTASKCQVFKLVSVSPITSNR